MNRHCGFAYLVPRHAVLPHGMSQHQVGKGSVVGAAVVAIALLAGCADPLADESARGDSTGSTGTTSGSSIAASYDHPVGAEDVLVSIDVSGGYQPSDLRDTAEFLLLGEGTAIAAAAVDTVFPGPAIRPLQSTVVTAEDIQQLFGLADDSGLLVDGIDFGEPRLQDLPYTTVSLTVDGRTVTHSVYALGFDDDDDADLDDDQRALRRALRDFIEAAQATLASDSASYTPMGVVAYRIAIETTLGDPANEQEPVPWPIATLPPPIVGTSPTSCVTVTGSDAASLLGVLAGANESTPWLIGTGTPTQMIFRPQLPGDPGCT